MKTRQQRGKKKLSAENPDTGKSSPEHRNENKNKKIATSADIVDCSIMRRVMKV